MQIATRHKILALALLTGLTVGCTNMSKTEQGTVTGAGIGAAAGAGALESFLLQAARATRVQASRIFLNMGYSREDEVE